MIEVYGYSIATIPVACAVVYGFVEVLKNYFFKENERFKQFIPIIATASGALFTLAAFYICPELVPVSTWYSALIVGGASGLSAVGINQISKQISKNDKEYEKKNDDK